MMLLRLQLALFDLIGRFLFTSTIFTYDFFIFVYFSFSESKPKKTKFFKRRAQKLYENLRNLQDKYDRFYRWYSHQRNELNEQRLENELLKSENQVL